MTTLYWRAANNVQLADALAIAALPGAVALLSTPTDYHVAGCHDGQPRTPDGPVDLDRVYHCRTFTRYAELRWQQTSAEYGRAVALAEDPARLPTTFGHDTGELPVAETIGAEYLLWGTVLAPPDDGWTATATSRVGTLRFPASGVAGHRLRLNSVEYVAIEPEHGNAYVAEERLVDIDDYPPPSRTDHAVQEPPQ